MEQTDKVLENTLTVKRKRIMTYFIEATEKLIRSEGLDGLSIRKIAGEAGYRFDHRFGVDPRYPEAVSIIDKVKPFTPYP